MKNNYRQISLIALFVIFSVVYMLQTLHVSASSDAAMKYNLSDGDLIKLSLSVAIPLIVIWTTGLVGYLGLRSYTHYIRDQKDGEAINKVARGLFFLLLWLPVVAILNRYVKDLATNYPAYADTFNRIGLYINIALLLVGYYWLYMGAKKAWHLVRPTAYKTTWHTVGVVFYVALAVVYVVMVFWHSEPGGHTILPYLPDWAVFLSDVLPRLVMWYMGLEAVWFLYCYSKHVTGNIYKNAFRTLAIGVGIITLSLVLVGYLATINSLSKDLGLKSVLAVVYILLFIMAAGYVAVSVGASRLKRIEQV